MAIPTEQVTIIRSGLDPTNYVQGAAKIVDANTKISASGDQVVQTTTKTTRALVDGGSAFDRYRRQADEVYAAQQRLAQAQTAGQRAIATGRTDQTAYNATIAEYTRRLDEARSNADRNVTSFTRLATGSKAASFAIRDVGIQSIDVFQGLASGQPIMTTFIQQGSQIAQVAAVAGVSLGQLARGVASAIGSFIASPLGLAITGITALGAAIYTVTSRSAELDAAQRTLSVGIAAVGNSAQVSVSQLQGYVSQLKQAGVAAEDALKLANELGRNPSLTNTQRDQIARIVPDASTALNQDALATQKQLIDVALGQADAIKKLDEQLNILNPNLAATVSASKDATGAIRDSAAVMDALETRVKGLNAAALSPTAEMFRDLKTGWNDFIDAIAKSDFAKYIVEGWTDIFRTLAGAIRSAGAEVSIGGLNEERAQLEKQARDIQSGKTGGGIMEKLGFGGSRLEEVDNRLLEIKSKIDQIRKAEQTTVSLSPSGVARDSFVAATASPSDAAAKALDAKAADRVGATKPGQVSALTREIEQYQQRLATLGPRNAENALIFDNLTKAIKADQDEVVKLNKTTDVQRTAAEKAIDKINAQIDAEGKMAEAYRNGGAGVAQVTAELKAQEQVIGEGKLKPGMAGYAEAVQKAADANLRLAQAAGQTGVEKQIDATNKATESQLRINEAWDGSAESLSHLQNLEKARALALSKELTPGQDAYNDAVTRYTDSLDRGSAASRTFQQAQQSVQALSDTLSNAFDRLGQSLTDAFLSGSGQAVNFGNIFRALAASIASDLVKLALINPVLNELLPSSNGARPTLGAALGVLGGGGANSSSTSSGGLFNSASNVGSVVGLTDKFGLTNVTGSIKNYLGLGDVGGGINSFLSTSAGVGPSIATTVGPGQTAFLNAAGVNTAGGVASIGSIAGGLGAGFGAGSLVGGLVQGAAGKVGPGPTIGAGAGAAIGTAAGVALIPVLGPFGPIIGGLVGGVLGGGTGGLIGPKPPSPFSSTGVGVDATGRLLLGATSSQGVDPTADRANATTAIAAVNAGLDALSIRIADIVGVNGPGRALTVPGSDVSFQVGQQSPKGPVDPSKFGDFATAFPNFRFSAADASVNTAIAGRSFADTGELQTVVGALQGFVATLRGTDAASETDRFLSTLTAAANADLPNRLGEIAAFVTQVVPSLTAANDNIGSLAQSTGQITAQYQGAIAVAQQLGYAEDKLTAARDAQIAKVTAAANLALLDVDRGLNVRATNAAAALDPTRARGAALYSFDITAEQQRRQFTDQLTATYGDAFRETQAYTDQIALLDTALGQERLAINKQYDDQVAAAAKQAADQAAQVAAQAAADAAQKQAQAVQSVATVISSITDYARGLQTGADSPLSPTARFNLASSQFNAVSGAANAGDFDSIRQLTSYAEDFRLAARDVYGSGVGFVQAEQRILGALSQISQQSPDQLTAAAFTAETRASTTALLNAQATSTALLQQILAELKHAAMRAAA